MTHQPSRLQILNWIVIASSVLVCLLLLPARLPGMELLGISPNWLLIWVVTWSINRSAVQGAIAGGALGLIQDGMTSGYLLHTFSLAIIGFLTARLQKQRYIQEDFISVALIVFMMTIVGETLTAIQLRVLNLKINSIWSEYQRIVLASAILSSLWAPVLYFPLSRWWQLTKESS